LGGAGDDLLKGTAGPDLLDLGSGQDLGAAGAGDDIVKGRDGLIDEIRCREGTDEVFLDGYDLPLDTGCERIRRRGAPRAIPEWSYTDGTTLDTNVGCPIDMPGACRVIVTGVSLDTPRWRGSTRVRIRPGHRAYVGLFEYDEGGTARVTALTLRDRRPPLRATRIMEYDYYGGE
jgi:Ca2+-binding RTX toxin-like protein